MKQILFMVLTSAFGVVGCLVRPFYGVAIYYLFSVLRPQAIWQWSLPPEFPWSRLVALATVGSVLMLGAGRRGDQEEPRPIRGLSHVLLMLNFAWLCVCYFKAQDRGVAFTYFNEYIKIFVMIAVASLAIRRAGELWALVLIAALSLTYIAYEVNFLYFRSGYIGIARNGYGGLDNNGAGLMLAMGVPLCVAAWDTAKTWWRWLLLAFVPVLVHAVLMTYSRGAMVSLIVASPLVLARSRRKGQLSLLTALLVALAIPVMAGPEIRARFLTLESHEVDESANQRRRNWAAAWRMVNDHPLFGTGIRNSALFSQNYGAGGQGWTIHNNYLQIAADTGFPGIGLYLLMLGSVLLDVRRVRGWCRDRDDLNSRRLYGTAYGVEGAMATFCTGAVFLSLENFELPFLLLLIGAQGAALVRGAERREAEAAAEWPVYGQPHFPECLTVEGPS
jgi:probable O-glycosylation ligase (exosortase A-associated)